MQVSQWKRKIKGEGQAARLIPPRGLPLVPRPLSVWTAKTCRTDCIISGATFRLPRLSPVTKSRTTIVRAATLHLVRAGHELLSATRHQPHVYLLFFLLFSLVISCPAVLLAWMVTHLIYDTPGHPRLP